MCPSAAASFPASALRAAKITLISQYLSHYFLAIFTGWLLKSEGFEYAFGTDWGLSIVGRWLAIMPDSEGEAGFRIRYSVACLLPVPSMREPDAAAELATPRWLNRFCSGLSLEKLSGGNWIVRITMQYAARLLLARLFL